MFVYQRETPPIIGSLSNDDSNENGNKPIGLYWPNNNFVRTLRFLYISLPSLHGLKMPNFTWPYFNGLYGEAQPERGTSFFRLIYLKG